MNNQDLINSIFAELRKSMLEAKKKYQMLSKECALSQDNDDAKTMYIVAQTYERALSKVIEIEVKTRIMAIREEEEDDRRS